MSYWVEIRKYRELHTSLATSRRCFDFYFKPWIVREGGRPEWLSQYWNGARRQIAEAIEDAFITRTVNSAFYRETQH